MAWNGSRFAYIIPEHENGQLRATDGRYFRDNERRRLRVIHCEADKGSVAAVDRVITGATRGNLLLLIVGANNIAWTAKAEGF